MSANIYVVGNFKGGVGKSTVAQMLGFESAAVKNRKTLVINSKTLKSQNFTVSGYNGAIAIGNSNSNIEVIDCKTGKPVNRIISGQTYCLHAKSKGNGAQLTLDCEKVSDSHYFSIEDLNTGANKNNPYQNLVNLATKTVKLPVKYVFENQVTSTSTSTTSTTTKPADTTSTSTTSTTTKPAGTTDTSTTKPTGTTGTSTTPTTTSKSKGNVVPPVKPDDKGDHSNKGPKGPKGDQGNQGQGNNQGNGSNQGSTVNHNNDKGNNSSDNHGGRLPQTGSKKAIVPLTELGLLLIAVAVIAVVYARKRKER